MKTSQPHRNEIYPKILKLQERMNVAHLRNVFVYLATFVLLTGAPAIFGKSENKVTKEGDTYVVSLTGNDQMKYNITAFEVPAGSTVRIEMENIGKLPAQAMSHNFVVLEPDTDPNSFSLTAAQARASNFIPESMTDSILAHTQLLGPGESDSIEFEAPPPGDYTYLCSFPAHYQTGMTGTMSVTK
ncbi:MAG: multicopper oxidase domain-containing protein [Verrucomicrobiae bacterium]|nr:multicopper oxidase domain-containing protein [Verrucomicrobiae bacterium]